MLIMFAMYNGRVTIYPMIFMPDIWQRKYVFFTARNADMVTMLL